MTLVPQQRSPLQGFTIDALLRGSARLRADRAALSQSGEGVTSSERLTFGGLAAETEFLAGSLAACGLIAGERILIVGAAERATVLVALAAMRLGLDVALTPLGAEPQEIEDAAALFAPQAVAAPARCGDIASAPLLFRLAGSVPSVRFVALHGGDEDGAVRLDDASFSPPPVTLTGHGALVTFARRSGRLEAVRHDESVLVAAGLDFIARAQIGVEWPILSLIPPTSLAGFVAGPMACLLSGAELALHAPFDLAALRADMAARPVHLVIPDRHAADAAEEITRDARIATLVSVTRDGRTPPLTGLTVPVCDLHAIGEIAVSAAMRSDGVAASFPGDAHVLPIDSSHIVALEARQTERGVEWRGAAVSGGEEWREP